MNGRKLWDLFIEKVNENKSDLNNHDLLDFHELLEEYLEEEGYLTILKKNV